MKIKEYKIITDGNLYELQAVVNQHISQGWVPLGGVSVGFHQTMVLYEEEEFPPIAIDPQISQIYATSSELMNLRQDLARYLSFGRSIK